MEKSPFFSNRSLRIGLEILGVAVLYFLAARLGSLLSTLPGNVSCVWPPSGIALAAILILGLRSSFGVLIGSLASNTLLLSSELGLSFGIFPVAFGMSMGAFLEAVLGGFLVNRFSTGNPLLRVGDTVKLLALGGPICCLVSAVIGVSTLSLAGLAPEREIGSFIWTWWLGDVTGVFVLTPFLLAWSLPRPAFLRRRVLEAITLLVSAMLVSKIVFGIGFAQDFPGYRFTFLLLPLFLWASFRFFQTGATTIVLLTSGFAIWCTANGVGPFFFEAQHESLLALQTFTAVVSATMTILSVVVWKVRTTQARLLESEQRFRELADHIHDVFWIYDLKERKLIYVSSSFERIWGFDSKLLLSGGISWESTIHPEERDSIKGAFFSKAALGEFSVEYRIHRPDGSTRWIWDRGFPIRDETGRTDRVAGLAEDITERKLSEQRERRMVALKARRDVEIEKREELQELTDRYRSLFEDSPISLWEEDFSEVREEIDQLSSLGIIDLDHYFSRNPSEVRRLMKKIRITDINKTTLELYEARDKKDLSANIERVFDQRSYETFRQELIALAAGKSRFEAEVETQTLSGRQMTVKLNLTVAPGFEGSWRKIFISIIDITAIKKAEGRLIESEKLLRSLSSRLIAVQEDERRKIAREIHDGLGQELAAIKMGVTLAKEGRAPHDRLELVVQSIDRMIQSIRRMATELRPLVLDELGLIAAIEWQKDRFQKLTSIECGLEIDCDSEFDHKTSTAIFRILQEGLSNVARHSKASKIDISLREVKGASTLEIRDNGIGMKKQKQLSASKSLGLASIRERALSLGGTVEIESRYGQGTSLRIMVPNRKIAETASINHQMD